MQHDPSTLDGLQQYQESPHVSRLFCRTCGAHVFARLEQSERYLVASGVLVARNTPPVKAILHCKTDDTGDGGLSTFLPGWPSVDRCALWVNSGHSTSGDASETTIPKRRNAPAEHRDKLHAQCHCGGIDFYMTPPDASSSQAWSPWCDLLVPYHSGSSDNPDDVKWWLRDGDTKFLAGTCACRSCRLASGFPIQTWAFIPKSNIFNADGSPLSFDRGAMRRHTSSPGVYREFCGVCGATVFWHNDGRPTIIDVSVGLFQGKQARAEQWLEWATGRVSFAETAAQSDLVELLEKGMRLYSAT
ncbi:hypothetical protein N7532_011146 [Penicillium argentinense]|uniref:CENP-V/GFA domain-containing protein n=1 Tax=Penicillium argentinense TaxID=1131581 RepID=A0A9W9EHV1_9EURO|nr:uncharacterized protein N7532_011146 [Penicillium argentinense]KAJ5082103.1 hypothetical protein N7532_011146 [Penicillium argentinense]